MAKKENSLKLIKNEEKYYEFIRTLRTDPTIISSFVSQVKITSEQQKIYMKNYCNNYFICLKNSKPVGFIGIVDKDLRLAVKQEFQKQGIASFMLDEINKMNIEYEVKIKSDNIKSLNFFKKKGFKESGKEIKSDQELIIMKPN